MHKSKNFNTLKVALIYDHVTTSYGGAELVLQTLQTIFPNAPIFTSVYDLKNNNWAQHFIVKTSFLQKIPYIKKLHQIIAPLHPIAFESFDLSSFDIIISVSNGPSKGVLTLPHQLHVCYMLSPTRYLSQQNSDTTSYLKSQPVFNIPGVSFLAKPFLRYMAKWDYIAAQRPDKIIAISKLISKRIEAAYKRVPESIIYPPFKSFSKQVEPLRSANFYLCLTRLVSYKRIDLAIKAMDKKDRLIIAGSGVNKSTLLSLAGNNAYSRQSNESITTALTKAHQFSKSIIFLGSCSEYEKHQLLSSCKALLMPGEEDFGLVGLEAAAHGKPVVTYYKSGIAEVLKDGVHSIHTKEKTVKAVKDALKKLESIAFSSKKSKDLVEEYESEWFRELFHKTIYHFWQQHSTISADNYKTHHTN